MSDRRLWTNQEDQIIINLVQLYGLKKWTTVADEMKKIFPQLARSSKQIRQRWYNHLDPEINKKPWTAKEEEILFQAHKKYGNKWKEIAKHLQSRTDNSAKNHFYSTLRRSLRRINKFLGFKNSTNQMKVLKPSILSKLVQSADHNEESRALVNGIFQFANIKPSKSKKKSQQDISIEGKDFFRHAIEKIISFNDKYGQNRQVLKKKKTNRGLNIMKIIPHEISPKRQHRSNKASSTQKSQQVPTSFHSSKSPYDESYEISVISRQSWQESAQKNCGMLPELEKPEEEEIMCIEQNPPEFYHFDIQTQKIFEEIEIGFINN